jgi:hypothetical protein
MPPLKRVAKGRSGGTQRATAADKTASSALESLAPRTAGAGRVKNGVQKLRPRAYPGGSKSTSPVSAACKRGRISEQNRKAAPDWIR